MIKFPLMIQSVFKQSRFLLSMLFATVLCCLPAMAQLPGVGMGMIDPVKWSHSVQRVDDSTAVLRFAAEIEDGWHLYSQYQKGTGLPLVFSFEFSQAYGIDGGDTLRESPHYTEHYDSFLKETEFYLSEYASFEKRIKIFSTEDFAIDVRVDGQACRDGACVPVSAKFVFDIKGRNADKPVKNAVQKDSKLSQVFPVVTGIDSIGQTEKALPDTDKTPVAIIDSVAGIGEVSADHVEDSGKDESLLWFFLLSFGGGIVALLTPCVFPVIPMTVSYFMKHGGLKQALFYGFSIIFIFMLVGLVFAFAFGENAANYISTHWLPNVLFAAIFVFFAFSLFGYFELSLPSKWVNKSAGASEKAGYAGTFFMALTLVLASFSCTLPIAGTVILNAAAGGFVKPLVGMLGFSLAFALPFTAFALFPSFLAKLPKSGSWMNTLKVTLAFVELAFALKFLSVPDQTYHWGILDREVYLALWIVLSALLGLYLLGKLRFPHDDERPVQNSLPRFLCAIACLAFTVYMVPGMFGAPLNALSGWLPPMHTQDFKLSQAVPPLQESASLCAVPSFSKDLSAPDGVAAYFDYDEALACAKAQDKPLFIDFSGHGCVNCRKVEQMVFSDAKVQTELSDNFVVAALYVDDKVLQLPEELQTRSADGKKITLLGEKNSVIQNEFGYNSQPCYLVIDPQTGKPLAQPLFYETDPEAFLQYLEAVQREVPLTQ